jgi:glutathione S-transferase
MRTLCRIAGSTGIITFAIGPRSLLLQQPKAAREANINAIPDPVRRAARRSVIEHGVKAPEFSNAISVMLAFMEAINESLEEKNWLSGESFGLADAAVLPYVLRLDHLTMTPVLEARPHLMAWYQRVQALNCFETAVTARLAPPLVEMFRKNGEAVWADVEPMTH